MTPVTRRRLTVLVAIAAFGLVVAFAVADNITRNAPPKDDSQATASGYLDGSAGAPLTAPDSSEEEPYTGGLQERLAGTSEPDKKKGCKGEKPCEKKDRDDDAEGTAETIPAAFAPASSDDGGNGLTPPCTDADSCVGEIEQLIPRVRERVSDLPLVRECTSSIGGEALCFDFGDGEYLVGDAPDEDGAEIGFCSSSGYYYVSGPTLEGGAGVDCPDEPGNSGGGNGDDAPTTRECTSSTGGQATCFDFGDGQYIVNDPFADGGGEVGFCDGSDYHYVSGPTGTADTGGKCPDAAAAAR
jgi:hypothetical protein